MKLLSILSIAFVAAQGSESNKEAMDKAESTKEVMVDKVAECFKEKNCGDDVNCKAKCVGVPSPDTDVVKKTDECYSDCAKSSSGELEGCRAKCDQGFINLLGHVPSAGDPKAAGEKSVKENLTGSSNSTVPKSDARGAVVSAASLLATGLIAICVL